MNPDVTIDTYVGDVVRQLPRKQRNDVGYELTSLLTEELHGRAIEAGRDADSVMVIELLAAFGRPADVADRYRPAGFTVIRPSEAPRFAWIGLGGVVLQWILSLIATFTASVDSSLAGTDWLSRLGGWWLSWGLGSFWWPGFLVSLSLIAGWISARRQESTEWAVPRASALDRDKVSRPVMALWIALGVVGASLVIALPSLASWATGLPDPLLAAFAFDGDFLATRAPWVLVLWAASLAVAITVLVAGRWVRLTRRLTVVVDIAWIALLIWWIAADPIFAAASADGVTKSCLAFIAALVVLDIVLTLRRTTAPIHEPTVSDAPRNSATHPRP